MGTRSVVARHITNGEFDGRYVHWDGYPSHMLRALYEFIRRDGYETTCRVLIDEHTGWSVLDPFQSEDDETHGDHIVTEQYWGKYYNDTPDEPFIKTFDEAIGCGAEYIYIIVANDNDPVEIHCYNITDGITPVAIEKVLCDHEYDSYCANCGVNA